MITTYTTPYHYFIIPFTPEQIDSVYITYAQNGENVIEKTITDTSTIIPATKLDNAVFGNEVPPSMNPTDSIITIHLTQEETSQFHFYPAAEKNIAIIQVRVKTATEEVHASRPIRDRISGVLKKEII